MSESTICIGTIGFPVNKKKLYPHVDIVEVMETYLTIPKPSTATKWRDDAPDQMAFSLQVPRHLFEVPTDQSPLPGSASGYGGFKPTQENIKLFERTCRVAENLRADTLVLLTPVSFTPAQNSRESLRRFLQETNIPNGLKIVWQPSGPWDHEQALAYADSLGLLLALDPLRDVPQNNETAYFRLGPFAAMGSRIGVYDLERLYDVASGFRKATIVFGTPRALDDARNLKKVIAEAE